MKLVINNCYGGYSLSAKAMKMYYGLKGIECYFFNYSLGDKNTEISLEEAQQIYFGAYSVKTSKRDHNTYLTNSPEDRTDPDLVRVVETLGEEANGRCAELKVINIPDGIKWEIDDYDGIETVNEVHRSWS